MTDPDVRRKLAEASPGIRDILAALADEPVDLELEQRLRPAARLATDPREIHAAMSVELIRLTDLASRLTADHGGPGIDPNDLHALRTVSATLSALGSAATRARR